MKCSSVLPVRAGLKCPDGTAAFFAVVLKMPCSVRVMGLLDVDLRGDSRAAGTEVLTARSVAAGI